MCEAGLASQASNEAPPRLAAYSGGPDMDLDLTNVRSFMILAQELHFGRAAKRLHVTSSALTKRIQRLEHQVGADLVDRRAGGGARVTLEGERLLQHAPSVLAAAAAALDAVRHPLEVRLGVPGQLGDYPPRPQLHAIAKQLRRLLPGTMLKVCGIPFNELTHSLVNRQVDVLLTVVPADNPRLRSSWLGTCSRVGIVSATHELAGTNSIDVDQFLALPMTYASALPQQWREQFYLGDIRPLADANLIAIEGQNIAQAMRGVSSGNGITAAPLPIARLGRGSHLSIIHLQGAAPGHLFGCVRRSDHREVVEALLEAITCIENTPLAALSRSTVPSACHAVGESGQPNVAGSVDRGVPRAVETRRLGRGERGDAW